MAKASSSQPGVVHVNHNLELFMASRAFSSQKEVVHVNHNSKLFVAFVDPSS